MTTIQKLNLWIPSITPSGRLPRTTYVPLERLNLGKRKTGTLSHTPILFLIAPAIASACRFIFSSDAASIITRHSDSVPE